jgi:photosystem II stability/assembly factor-like uncharacterized protein
MTRIRLFPWLAAALALAAAPTAARANGRFPASIDVHFKPGDHDVMALQVTFGLIMTRDGGDTWHWSCEEAIGFGGIYDPDYELTPSGLLFATSTAPPPDDGLRMTTDLCTWSAVPAPLGSDGTNPAKFVSQIEVGPTGTIWAATPYELAPAEQIYRSTDDGDSWQPLSRPLAGTVDWWESMEVSPTLLAGSQTRIYMTGYGFGTGGEKLRYLVRSDDSGQTWVDLGVDEFTFGGDLADLQLAAVSPTDPDLVFARVFQANGRGIGDDIYRSDDAGASWTRVFQSGDNVNAVLVRETGQVVLGTGLSGVHVSADGGQTFGEVIDDTKIQCMKERDDGLVFACGVSFAPDDMGLGTGTTIGAWTSILNYDQIDDAWDCPSGTPQRDVCQDQRWCTLAEQFGASAPECAAVPDAGPDENPPPGKTCCGSADPAPSALLALLVALVLIRKRPANP